MVAAAEDGGASGSEKPPKAGTAAGAGAGAEVIDWPKPPTLAGGKAPTEEPPVWPPKRPLADGAPPAGVVEENDGPPKPPNMGDAAGFGAPPKVLNPKALDGAWLGAAAGAAPPSLLRATDAVAAETSVAARGVFGGAAGAAALGGAARDAMPLPNSAGDGACSGPAGVRSTTERSGGAASGGAVRAARQ